MSPLWIGLAQIALTLGALALIHRPFGAYMAHIFTTDKDLGIERVIYRICGVDPRSGQRWKTYFFSVLAFSAVSVLTLYLLQRLQQWLPLSLGMGPVHADQAWNTAVSFTTNTNWQSYSGEEAMSILTQMSGLAVQNFVSAAVGIAVAIALIRGIAARSQSTLGNFWVDLTRGVIRLLLPISAAAAFLLILGGAVQSLQDPVTVNTITGGTQTIMTGTTASQEAIKELGTNGGGYFNANSAHPFENPQAWTNLLEIFLILMIPTALPRTFGIMVGDKRQGWAVLGAMGVLYAISLTVTLTSELANTGSAISQAGAAMEGKEVRLDVVASSFFATSTTLTSTGAVDSFHSSYSGFGGGMLTLNMLLGEIAPGGVGAGLYGMLVVALLSVFIAGLMVGRSPEYLGKRIGPREIKLISLYILVVPVLVLCGTGLAIALPSTLDSILNPGPHGLSEVLYAYTSASNNNGSAFAGFNADTPFFNVTLGFAMLLGRFVPIGLVLALAGSLAEQNRTPETAGTLTTHRPLFVGVMVGASLIVTGLTFLPVLALGPIAEGLI